jgi:hypothetical protein
VATFSTVDKPILPSHNLDKHLRGVV